MLEEPGVPPHHVLVTQQRRHRDRDGAVAQPGEAVVELAVAAHDLRERRGGRRDHRAGEPVGAGFEHRERVLGALRVRARQDALVERRLLLRLGAHEPGDDLVGVVLRLVCVERHRHPLPTRHAQPGRARCRRARTSSRPRGSRAGGRRRDAGAGHRVTQSSVGVSNPPRRTPWVTSSGASTPRTRRTRSLASPHAIIPSHTSMTRPSTRSHVRAVGPAGASSRPTWRDVHEEGAPAVAVEQRPARAAASACGASTTSRSPRSG